MTWIKKIATKIAAKIAAKVAAKMPAKKIAAIAAAALAALPALAGDPAPHSSTIAANSSTITRDSSTFAANSSTITRDSSTSLEPSPAPYISLTGYDTGCNGGGFDHRPVVATYGIEVGASRDLSTYLSPLYYEGIDVAFAASWTKAFQRWPDRCVMRFEAALDFRRDMNPAKNAYMYGMTGRFGWGLMWRKDFLRDFTVTVGPMAGVYGGALYLVRNGNNPVTALFSAGIDVAASLTWRFRAGRLPMALVDEVRIPTLSGFFCPGYGETYYEIYLGNRRGLAHFGWWGNAGGVDNLLSLRMNLGRTGLLVGYRFDLRAFRANHLQTQLMRHCLQIAVIPGLGRR